MQNCCFPEMARTIYEQAGSNEAAHAIFWLMAELGKQTDEINIKALADSLGFNKQRTWRLVRRLISDGILIRKTVTEPLHNRNTDCNKDRNTHAQRLIVTIQYSKLFEKLNRDTNRNTNRNTTVTEPFTKPSEIITLQQPSKPVEKPVDKPKKGEAKSTKVVEAYSQAYANAYNGVRPVRNAKLNSIACRIIDAVGEDVAIQVVQFYLTHRGSWYVQKKHELEYCLKDVQGLRTEMLAGFQITNSMANKLDKNSEMDQTLAAYRKMKAQKAANDIGF